MMQFMEDGRADDNRALKKFEETVMDRARKLGIEYERECFPSCSQWPITEK